jgi:hypothetical protein
MVIPKKKGRVKEKTRQNGLRYPLVGGCGQGSLYRKCSGVESSLFNGTNPTSRVHAMLGGLHAEIYRRVFTTCFVN